MNPQKIFFSVCHSESGARLRKEIEAIVKKIGVIHPDLAFSAVFGKRYEEDEWQARVSELIQECAGFVCVVGEDTKDSTNISWEIKTAFLHRKPVIVAKADPSHCLPEEWSHLAFVPLESAALEVALLSALLPSSILNRNVDLRDAHSQQALLSQYTIMVESWESLVNRRQNVNSFYSAVIAVMLGGIGACLGHFQEMGRASAIVGVAISILGIFLSVVWRQMLTSYGTASRAKSDIVISLEQHLPARVFELEWKVMEMRKYSPTTKKDARIAEFFTIAFLLSLLLAIAMVFQLVPVIQNP